MLDLSFELGFADLIYDEVEFLGEQRVFWS